MANTKLFKQSFAGGEIAPEMLGRIDDNKFQTGLQTCRNFIVKPQGAVENRAGFEYIRPVKYEDKRTRLLPFYFTNDQTLVIEFGAGYCRFHTLAATIMDNFGNPYEIETPYAEEDLFDVHYVQSADVLTLVHTKYPPKELRRYGATDWRLVDINFMPDIGIPQGVNATATGTGKLDYYYVVTAMDADNISESSPSDEVHVVNNLYADNTNKNTITWQPVTGASRYRVYKRQSGIYGYLGQTTETYFDDDQIDPDMSSTPPLYEEIFKTGGITSVGIANGGSGYIFSGGISHIDVLNSNAKIMLSDGEYEVNKKYNRVDNTSIMVIGVIEFKFVGNNGSGAKITVKIINNKISKINVLEGGDHYLSATLSVQQQMFAWKPWTILLDTMAFNVVVADQPKLVLHDPTGYGAVIQPVIKNGVVTSVNVIAKGQNYTNPTITMSSNAGSGFVCGQIVINGQDYPGAVSYFQQRKVFAGTIAKPQNIWMTRSGTESNMSYSIPVKDDDRIAVRVAAREASRILHIVSLTNLMLLTNSAEWKVGTNNSDVLTPSTISVMPYSYVGASNAQPVTVNTNMIYAASRGGHVRELAYSWQAGGYVTGDISLRAPHLFDHYSIVEFTQSKAPIPIIWAVSSSGKLLGCTYIPEQEIGGWHQHHTLNGEFLACASVPEGKADMLYVITRRMINGNTRQFIERMAIRDFIDIKDAFFVDCGLTYRGEPTDVISGLLHLEGETVSIFADGAVMPKQKVKLGKIHLQEKASLVHVGLQITADIKTLPMAAQIDSAYGQGRLKNINKAWVRVWRSGGIFIGADVDNLTEIKQRTTERAGNAPALKSEEIEVTLLGRWNDSGQLLLRQADPLPLTVVSMTTEISAGG